MEEAAINIKLFLLASGFHLLTPLFESRFGLLLDTSC